MKLRTVPIESLERLSHPDTFESTESYELEHLQVRSTDPYFEQFWCDAYESKLIRIIQACGVHYHNYLFDSFYGDFVEHADGFLAKKSFQRDLFQPDKHEQQFYYALTDYLLQKAENTIKEGRASLYVRKRWCSFSNTYFDDHSYGASISFFKRRIPEVDVLNYWLDINPQCLLAFKRIGDADDVRNSVSAFGQLLNTIAFVPPQNATELTILANIEHSRFIEVLSLMANCFYPVRYAECFGDYITALFQSGYLGDSPILKSNIGYRVKAIDGHICNSLAEKVIDDWLFSHGVEHEKEPHYPDDVRQFSGSNIRADWRVGNTFIEYFGLQSMEEYAKKTDLKLHGCEKHGVNLLALYPGDERRLDYVLQSLLESSGQLHLKARSE